MEIKVFKEFCEEFKLLSFVLNSVGIDSDEKVLNLVKNILVKKADLNLLDATNKNGEIEKKFHIIIRGAKSLYCKHVTNDISIGSYVGEMSRTIPVQIIETRKQNGDYTITVYKQVDFIGLEHWNQYKTEPLRIS